MTTEIKKPLPPFVKEPEPDRSPYLFGEDNYHRVSSHHRMAAISRSYAPKHSNPVCVSGKSVIYKNLLNRGDLIVYELKFGQRIMETWKAIYHGSNTIHLLNQRNEGIFHTNIADLDEDNVAIIKRGCKITRTIQPSKFAILAYKVARMNNISFVDAVHYTMTAKLPKRVIYPCLANLLDGQQTLPIDM